MAKQVKPQQSKSPSSAKGTFSAPLKDLPCLQVFGLPYDADGDIKVQLTFTLPAAAKTQIPKYQEGNRGLVKIKVTPNSVEITTQKIWGLSWDFFRKQFGAPFAKFLMEPPPGTELLVSITHKKSVQTYRGPIANGVWRWTETSPAIGTDVLKSAWQIASLRFDKRIRCNDDAEADAIEAAAAKNKYLRGMGVKRNGLAMSCTEDEGHLAALLFQHRLGNDWQLPDLGKKKPPRPDPIEAAIEKWRQTAAPTKAALAGFESIQKLLLEQTANSPLKSKVQEFPPKRELVLPAKKKGQHEWDFASVAAVGDEVYFDLFPLGLDVTLRDSVSRQLGQKSYRPEDGFKLAGSECKKFLGEMQKLIAAAFDWFATEIIEKRPLPPCQLIDQCLIDPSDWLADPDAEKEPGFDSYAERATYLPLDDVAKSLQRRLEKHFGKGNWQRAELTVPALLAGWKKPTRLELHWYDARKAKQTREPWKIKRFHKPPVKEAACEQMLRYAARSDFLASLEQGKSYRCTATLGQKFQAYVQVIDESGEAYWYPERFFVVE